MRETSTKSTCKVRATVAGFFFALAAAIYLSPNDLDVAVYLQTGSQTAAQVRKRRYSEFRHDIKAHRRECSSCHKFPSANWKKVRAEGEAFPDIADYPKHESCLNCHRTQFFSGVRPAICTICHTNPGPRNSNRHPFPNPRERFDASSKGKTAPPSDFAVHFPHIIHVDIVTANGAARSVFRNASFARAKRAEESCAVCHATLNPQGNTDVEFVTKPPDDLGEGFWLKKGTFKTAPLGHARCFTCHSQDSGIAPAPTNCAACHKLRQAEPAADFDPKLAGKMGVADRVTLDLWRSRHSSGKYRHEWVSHAELSCATCHNVEAMSTTDWRTEKVAVSSCSMCHTTATSAEGGALNVEADSRKTDPKFNCTKCHITFGTRPIPESHTKAIADATGIK